MDLLSTLHGGGSVFAAELRPPRAELATNEGMDAWIDTYHAVTRLTRRIPRASGAAQPSS